MLETKRSFWKKDFVLALTGYFFLFLSVTLFLIFPLHLKIFGPSESRLGLIMGIHSLTAIFIRPFFGRRIDTGNRKKISLLGIGIVLAAVPFFHFVRDAGALPLVLRALTGLGWGIGMTAMITMCSDLAPVDRLAHSVGIVGVAGLVASALGPLLAEEIVRRFGFGGLFNASIISLMVAFLFVLVTKDPGLQRNEKSAPAANPLKSVALSPFILVAAVTVLHGATRGAIVNFIALFCRSMAIERVGPFFVALSAAAILTRLGIGDISDRVGRKKVIFPAALIIALNLVLISQIRGFGLLVVSGFIAGLGQGLIYPALNTYIIDFLGFDNKGLAMGLYFSLFDAGVGLGSPFFGWVSDLAGYRNMYLLAAALLFLFSLIFTFKAPSPPAVMGRKAWPNHS